MSEQKRDDGGPAFPQLRSLKGNHVATPPYFAENFGGMTLRDYFAGQVISRFLRYSFDEHGLVLQADVDAAAMNAYRFADAMLEERSKQR